MMIVPPLNNSRSQRILWLLEELGLPQAHDFQSRRNLAVFPLSARLPSLNMSAA